MTMVVESIAVGRHDRLFFSAMAIAAAVTVFAGFAPSYYLRGSALPPLAPLVQLHGLVFTSWFLLFVAQTTLVAVGRIDIHRRLGIAGAVVGSLVVIVGAMVAIGALRHGAGPMFGMEPTTFFSIPMGDVIAFGILVAAAIILRRHADTHKRLMLLGTITILPAAIARLVIPLGGGLTSWFILGDLFVVAAVLYDLWSRGRVHPSLISGGLLIVVGKPLLVAASGTAVWIAFANAVR